MYKDGRIENSCCQIIHYSDTLRLAILHRCEKETTLLLSATRAKSLIRPNLNLKLHLHSQIWRTVFGPWHSIFAENKSSGEYCLSVGGFHLQCKHNSCFGSSLPAGPDEGSEQEIFRKRLEFTWSVQDHQIPATIALQLMVSLFRSCSGNRYSSINLQDQDTIT